jgi:hypothetical protein
MHCTHVAISSCCDRDVRANAARVAAAAQGIYSCDMIPFRCFALVVLCACGGSSASHDAGVDVDNGTCGSQLRFTGEYVDWDNEAKFCGIFGAQFAARGGTQAMTAPNGRFDLCVPDQDVTLVDVTPPAAVPDCKADKAHLYTLPAIAVANRAVLLAGGAWSGRAFVDGRQSYDPTRAQVFVHVDGKAAAVSLDAGHAHGAIQVVTAGAWTAGNAGQDVFIPDVDPAGGSATLAIAGGATGAGAIPLVAGKLTLVTVIAR